MKKSILILFFVSLLVACQTNDDVLVYYDEGTNEYVNDWMYTQMKRYYYWNESIPSKGSLSLPSKEYFSYLLSQNDPFSYAIYTSSVETFPQSVPNSFGFDLSFVEFEGRVYGVVLYVLSGSPAEKNALVRGHLITKIGGTALSQANCNILYQNLVGINNAQLEVVSYSEQSGFTTPNQMNITKGFTFLQTVRSTVITSQNHKVGYVEISHFNIGLSQSLLQVFQKFKEQLVTEVVVDLRYNGGGDVSSATALCILLAPNIEKNNHFIKFNGNKNGGEIMQTFNEALQMNESKVSYEALRAAHPQIQRVYVLCGSHTASASEIIINNMKPFMNVITIGEKTVGKDVASFAIEDDRIIGASGRWVLYPAIYKLFNANGEGNYTAGIQPSVVLDELENLEIHPLGNVNEVLLNRALLAIYGNSNSGKNRTSQALKKLPASITAEPILIKEIKP